MIEIRPHQMKTIENVIGMLKFEFKSIDSATGFIQVYVNENYIERVAIPPQVRLYKDIGVYGGDIILINTGPSTIMVQHLNVKS